MINKKPKIEVGSVLLCTKAPKAYEGLYKEGVEYTVEAVKNVTTNNGDKTVYDVRCGPQ